MHSILTTIALLASQANAATSVNAGGPYFVPAQATVELEGSASDTDDCLDLLFRWDDDGDGTFPATFDEEPIGAFDARGIDGNDESVFTVTIEMTCISSDADSESFEDEALVTVQNVAPDIDNVFLPAAITEGEEANFKVEVSDIEPADLITVEWSFGEDSATGEGTSTTYAFPDNGTYEVVVTATDDDGGTAAQIMEVSVDNANPSIEGDPATEVLLGGAYSFVPTWTDPGTDDSHMWDATLPENASVNTMTGEVTWTPSPEQLGTHALILLLTDDDGGFDTLNWSVTVVDGDTGDSDTGVDTGPVFRDTGLLAADGDTETGGQGCRCGTPGAASVTLALWPLIVLLRRRP